MSKYDAFNANAMMEDAAKIGPDPGGQADQLCAAENRKSHEMKARRSTEPHEIPVQRSDGYMAPPTLSVLSKPVGRPLQIVLSKVAIGMTDTDGLPGPNICFEQEFGIGYIDPERRCRTIGQQVDDLLAKLTEQAVDELEERRA